jgi:hypothetical protein
MEGVTELAGVMVLAVLLTFVEEAKLSFDAREPMQLLLQLLSLEYGRRCSWSSARRRMASWLRPEKEALTQSMKLAAMESLKAWCAGTFFLGAIVTAGRRLLSGECRAG